jgi:molybdopterin converting factor small subunit
MVKVHVASVLYEYTEDAPEVEARGGTLRAVLADLEKRHPGLRFRVVDEQDRIRQHMNVWVAGRPTRSLDAKVGPDDDVHILQALSGG